MSCLPTSCAGQKPRRAISVVDATDEKVFGRSASRRLLHGEDSTPQLNPRSSTPQLFLCATGYGPPNES